jgi:hypothetical protein
MRQSSADRILHKRKGSLIVNANFNVGIKSKDDLIITNGTITVYDSNGISERLPRHLERVRTGSGLRRMQATKDEDTQKDSF